MKMSPEVLAPMPPLRAIPSEARFAIRLSWCGSSGASVATTMMIEPWSFVAPCGLVQRPQRSPRGSESRVS